MIDIMLVLLIIFMIVTPLIASGFQASMPKGDNIDPRPEESDEIVLGIDQNGMYFLDARPIDAAVLEDHLRSVYAAREKDKILYFKADENLPYSKIEDAVEIARQAGVRVMAAVTEKKTTDLFGDGE